MDANLNATYEACNSFNNKLRDTLLGLISANNDRKSEIDALNSKLDSEAASRDSEDKALYARIDREISDRDKDTAAQTKLAGQTATKVATNEKRSARTDLTSQKGTKRQNTVVPDDDVQFLYQVPMDLEWQDYSAMCREHKAQLRRTDEARSGRLGETWALLGQAGVAGGTSGAAGSGQHQCDAGGTTCAASCIFSRNW